jgi:Uma2 family endonuclease
MAASDIVLPVTEPETEWVRGRPLQKVRPTRTHSLLQLKLGSELRAWAGPRGEVGSEWRFRVAPPGEPARPLIPDISYVRVDRLRGLTGNDLEVPRLSPDVAVEILSPGDRRADIDDKIATYLAAGSVLVMIVDPKTQTVELHDARGTVTLRAGDSIAHPRLPGFELSVSDLFEVIAPPR